MAATTNNVRIVETLAPPYVTTGPGVYALINRDNNKIYIGSSARLNQRWNMHRMELVRGNHSNRYLLRAFRKHPEAFNVEVVEELPSATKQTLLEREQFWMNFYRSYDANYGYNNSPTASSCLGVKHSPETCRKLSERAKGKTFSTERRKQHSIALKGHKGRTYTEQQIQECREKNLDHLRSAKIISKAQASIRKHSRAYNSKPVLQFTIAGKFIRRFSTIRQAGASFHSVDKGNIKKVCLGLRKHAFGFVWQYAKGQ